MPLVLLRRRPGVEQVTIEQLRAAHGAAPFRPFMIHMADGRTFPISHPDFLFITPAGRTGIVAHDDDSFNIIDVLLMTEIEVAPSQPTRP
jgi:hypothetical protein